MFSLISGFFLYSFHSVFTPFSIQNVAFTEMCFPSLAELNLEKENGNVLARVVSLWFVVDFNKPKTPFSMELLLQDKEVV